MTRASAYVIRSQLNLFNDFTSFLNDPVNGNQFHQLDQRIIGGGETLHVVQGDLLGRPMENEIGVQTRTDSIRVGLFNTTRSPFPVPSTGYEIGLRNRSIAGLETSLALFRLDFASENLFQGDTGTTEPSRPTRRFGVEWTNRYAVAPWLSLEGDLTITNARFSDYDPVGNRVPEAPTTIASAGVTFGEPLGWFGSLPVRYFGPRPLIEDNSIRSRATALVNGRIGYAFESGVGVSRDVLNLTNGKSDQITYAYVSRLPGEPAEGLIDRVFRPVEPTAVRLTIAGRF